MADELRELSPSTRLVLRPAATRIVGDELFVSVGGAATPVRRLNGLAPMLWEAFARGRSIAEAAQDLANRAGASPSRTMPLVHDFAMELVRNDLAETT